MPQPLPAWMLWNIIAVKVTNFISFSLYSNIAFATGRLEFPVSPNLEAFTFLKDVLCWKRCLFSLISYFYWLSALAPSPQKVEMLGHLFLTLFHSFTQSLSSKVIDQIFQSIPFHSSAWLPLKPLYPLCLPLWSRGLVLINEAGYRTHFRPTLQANCFQFSRGEK